jgi:hypothetical protein
MRKLGLSGSDFERNGVLRCDDLFRETGNAKDADGAEASLPVPQPPERPKRS